MAQLWAAPLLLGDLNADGQVNVLDITRLQLHLSSANPLSVQEQLYADANQDGLLSDADVTAIADIIMGLRASQSLPSPAILSSSPVSGEGNVSLTRETIIRFNQPLANTNVVTTNTLYAEFGGRRILSRTEFSTDRRSLTLFYLEPLPASARVRVTINGGLLASTIGLNLDADGDGNPGGIGQIDFDTASISPVLGTSVAGFVFASQLVPNGTNTTNYVNQPLRNVQITVDGAEQTLRAVTDSNGFFHLAPCPAGRFFVHVDGRTADGSQWPGGAYYPFVGKAWTAQAGYSNYIGNIYLPLISADALKTVSAVTNTVVTFSPSVISNNPALAGVSLVIPPNALLNDAGVRGGKVGIAPVPPDRLPEALPPGLNFPLVITFQTDGPQNFDQPVPVCFPNLPNPITVQTLPPGAKTALWSFNHDTGRWEIQGPMTVSVDGTLACSDPGVGIRQPGWHGVQDGTQSDGPPPNIPPPSNPPQPPDSPQIPIVLPPNFPPDYRPPFGPCSDSPAVNRDHFNACVASGFAGVSGGLLADAVLDTLLRKVCRGFFPDTVVGRRLCKKAFPDLTKNTVLDVNLAFTLAERCKDYYINCNDPTINTRALSASDGEMIINSLKIDWVMQSSINKQVDEIIGSITNESQLNAEQTAALAILDSQLSNLLEGRTEEEFYRQRLDSLQSILESLGSQVVFDDITAAFFLFEDVSNGLLLRGMTASDGRIVSVILRPETVYNLKRYMPGRHYYNVVQFRSGSNGEITHIPVGPNSEMANDTDADGLFDEAESIVGTNPFNSDSDADGITDGIEVEQGNDPLSNLPVQTGVIASADTPGNAFDVCTLNNLAVVADYLEGVVIFDVSGLNPVRIARVDTPGTAVRVACSGNRVAVADSAAGLVIVDISDPPAARIVNQLPLGAEVKCVAVAGNTVYAGLANGEVVTLDLLSATVLERVSTGAEGVEDLVVGQEVLYALTRTTLYSLSLSGIGLSVSSGINSPVFDIGGYNRRLFYAGNLLYVVQNKGANVFSLSNPLQPALLSAANTAQFDWKQYAPNGSRYALAAVGDGLGANDLELYDLTNPTNTQSFVTRFVTPGDGNAVSIYNGLAYVADGGWGLQVINYLAYDSGSNAPTLVLTNSFPMTSATNGVAEEGKIARVTALVSDDVQVRNVEFYIDGVRQVTDGNFPFEFRFVTPLRAGNQTNFLVQAKASDTGGNVTWSAPIVVDLVDDFTPPTVVAFYPASNAVIGVSVPLLVRFSEPMDTATLNATLSLTNAGPDGVFGTVDDQFVVPIFSSYSSENNLARFGFPTNSPLGLYKAVVGAPMADLAGIQMSGSFVTEFSRFAANKFIGRLLLANNAPVAGAKIMLQVGSNQYSSFSASDGTFEIPYSNLGGTTGSLRTFWFGNGFLYAASINGINLSTQGNNIGDVVLAQQSGGGPAVISANNNHSLGIRNARELWGWGYNSGQVGDGTFVDRLIPVPATGVNSGWIHVDAGLNWSAGVRADGSLWTWGEQQNGRLGIETNDNQPAPFRIVPEESWVRVSAGESHGIALNSNGTIWSWGYNLRGPLGETGRTNEYVPEQIGTISDYIAISAGDEFSHAIRADGSLWGWGYNAYGQLGDGTTTNRFAPVLVGGSNWVSVSSGDEHALALCANGTLWAWGRNLYGEIGDGTTTRRLSPVQIGFGTNWIAIAAGGSHSLALQSDGTLWAWGYNFAGQIGDGTTQTRYQPIKVGVSSNWVAIAAGDGHSLAVRADGSLWSWGWNVSGALGDGTTTDRLSPIQIAKGCNDWIVPGAGPPISTMPTVIAQPRDLFALTNTTVTVTASICGIPTPSVQWFFNGTPIAGANSPSLVLTNVSSGNAGNYWLVASNSAGSVTTSNAVLDVFNELTIGLAVNSPSLLWTTGGTVPWFPETTTAHDGQAAAESGDISDNQESWIETVVTGPGTLTFWWKVSSEPTYDVLRFYINGSQNAFLSGEFDWQQRTVNLPAGNQTLRWRFQKDFVATQGQDRGWLDQVTFTPQ